MRQTTPTSQLKAQRLAADVTARGEPPRQQLSVGVFALILLVAAGVRLWRLNYFSYWLDEILQSYWMHEPFTHFWKSIKSDAVHPPLDYLIGWVVELTHPSPWVRKLPAVIWGTATVGVIGLLVARRVGRLAGILSMLLLALAPFHVRYSQELRPYSLGIFCLCLTLLLLDFYLERPGLARLVVVSVSCLATMYALYLAAVVLALAMAAFLISDASTATAGPRLGARRFLRRSPAIAAALGVAYLPWWPVLFDAASRPSPVPVEPLTLHRIDRTLAFFAFAQNDGELLRWVHVPYLFLIAFGLIICLRKPRARPLALWPLLGIAAIEALEHLHPHWYATRWFLPAGVPLTALAGVGLAYLWEARTRWAGIGISVLALVLVLDCRTLREYFDHGRPDWRPLADFLRADGRSGDRVFTDDQWPQLCLAFYLDGPQWLFEVMQGRRQYPEVLNLEGERVRLTWSWKPGKVAWLVLHGDGTKTAALRAWAHQFEQKTFPTAENAVLVRLDPSRRDLALRPPR